MSRKGKTNDSIGDEEKQKGKPTNPGRGLWDTAKSTGKLLLKAVVEVSDVFPPLKAVSAGLQLIVDHVEVSLRSSLVSR